MVCLFRRDWGASADRRWRSLAVNGACAWRSLQRHAIALRGLGAGEAFGDVAIAVDHAPEMPNQALAPEQPNRRVHRQLSDPARREASPALGEQHGPPVSADALHSRSSDRRRRVWLGAECRSPLDLNAGGTGAGAAPSTPALRRVRTRADEVSVALRSSFCADRNDVPNGVDVVALRVVGSEGRQRGAAQMDEEEQRG